MLNSSPFTPTPSVYFWLHIFPLLHEHWGFILLAKHWQQKSKFQIIKFSVSVTTRRVAVSQLFVREQCIDARQPQFGSFWNSMCWSTHSRHFRANSYILLAIMHIAPELDIPNELNLTNSLAWSILSNALDRSKRTISVSIFSFTASRNLSVIITFIVSVECGALFPLWCSVKRSLRVIYATNWFRAADVSLI